MGTGSCSFLAVPHDDFGDGWAGSFFKVTAVYMGERVLVDYYFVTNENGYTAFENVLPGSGLSYMFDFMDGYCGYFGCGYGFLGLDGLQFEFSVVPGATESFGTSSPFHKDHKVSGDMIDVILPCDDEFPYYSGQKCNPFVRPWETSFSISAYGEPIATKSNQRTVFVGGIDSKITIECKPNVETVYGIQRQILLISEASDKVQRAGGAPVDFQAEFEEPKFCPGYSLDLLDSQGFGWHNPGKFSYTNYALDDGKDLLSQGTLAAGSSSERVEVNVIIIFK